MKLIRNTFVAGIAFTALTVAAACSSGHLAPGGSGTANNGPAGNGNSVNDGTGQVGLHLTLAPGVSLTSVSWTINGPNTYTGTETIGDAESLEFVQGGIVAGSGYTLTINGTDSQGDPCVGTSAPFTIVAGAVTQAVLLVTCTKPGEAGVVAAHVVGGSVEVDAGLAYVVTDAGVFNCSGISSFSISPSEINLSQTAALQTLTIGSPATVAYSVSPAGGGTFNTVGTAFKCSGTAAQVTITATANAVDPATRAACVGQPFETISALVNCELPGDASPPPPPDAGPDATADATPDATPDAPPDAPPPPKCPLNGSPTGTCTPTELLFAQHSATCITALFNNGCLDDTVGDTGSECTDAPAGTTPSGATRNQACLNVISCTLAHASAQPVLAFGYCGVQPSSTSCSTATPGQTGPCLAQEQDGEESTDPTTVLARYTSTNFGGGMANRIFNCAIVNVGGDPTLQSCLQ